MNPVSENFFGTKLIEMIGDLFSSLFVPSEDRLLAISNTVSLKFSFVDSLKIAMNSIKDIINNLGNAPKLTLNLGATKYIDEGNYVILDLSWYAPYKSYGDIVLTGFIYLIYVWRLFCHLPSLFNATASASDCFEKAPVDFDSYWKA